jgi:hypothetical protein
MRNVLRAIIQFSAFPFLVLLTVAVVIFLITYPLFSPRKQTIPPGYVIEKNGHGFYRWAIYTNGVLSRASDEWCLRCQAVSSAKWDYENALPWEAEKP